MQSWIKQSRLTRPLAALGLLTILSGCATTDQRNLTTAAEILGQTQAQVELAELPAECRQHIERVVPQIGEKPRWTQKRWEYVADAADQRTDNCAQFYDRQRELIQ